jgi:hypothetical protein
VQCALKVISKDFRIDCEGEGKVSVSVPKMLVGLRQQERLHKSGKGGGGRGDIPKLTGVTIPCFIGLAGEFINRRIRVVG